MRTNTGAFPEFVLMLVTKNITDRSGILELYQEAVRNLIIEEKQAMKKAGTLNSERLEFYEQCKGVRMIPFSGEINKPTVVDAYEQFSNLIIEEDDGSTKNYAPILIYDETIYSTHDAEGLMFGIDTEGLEDKVINDIEFGLRRVDLSIYKIELKKLA